MVSMYVIFFILYILTSRFVLLDKVERSVRHDYNVGSVSEKLYILIVLPIHYMGK